MKVVAILGSPRKKGNSARLARRVLAAAEAQGAETEVYLLNAMKYKGCQGCNSCKTETDFCVVKDDLTPVYESIRRAEVLVLASPVYFGDLSGQMKCFFDRFYAYFDNDFHSRLQPGKKSVTILTQGDPQESSFDDIFPRYERWLKLFGFERNYLLRAVGVREEGEVNSKTEVLRRAEEIGGEIVRNSE